jgi:HAD superfamily hydrolase (TIGR01509 family)
MIPLRDGVSTVSRTRDLALVFDLDGVIVDSNAMHGVSWRAYLRSFGVEAPVGFEQGMFGKHNNEIVRSVFGAGLDDAEVLLHGTRKEKLYREMMGPVLKRHLVPGLLEFLERHRDFPMAVASNAERANVDFVLDCAGIRDFFRVVLDGGQVRKPKPEPEIYLRAAELLGTPSANCIVFEDSQAGVQAARSSGARIVGLLTTHSGLPHVDLTIRDFLDPVLGTWLTGQMPVF